MEEQYEQELKEIKEAASLLALFSNVEIDFYYIEDNIEYVQFDFAAQNTGNIFNYQYDSLNKTFSIIEVPYLYTWNDYNNIEVPVPILEKIFSVARKYQTIINKQNNFIKNKIISQID